MDPLDRFLGPLRFSPAWASNMSEPSFSAVVNFLDLIAKHAILRAAVPQNSHDSQALDPGVCLIHPKL